MIFLDITYESQYKPDHFKEHTSSRFLLHRFFVVIIIQLENLDQTVQIKKKNYFIFLGIEF